jgi:hypothetical protein
VDRGSMTEEVEEVVMPEKSVELPVVKTNMINAQTMTDEVEVTVVTEVVTTAVSVEKDNQVNTTITI